MLVNVLIVFLISSGLASPSRDRDSYKDDSIFTDAVLDQIADYPDDNIQFDNKEDQADNKEDLNSILETLREIRKRHAHHRTRMKPYENYDDAKEEEFDRSYRDALIKLYNDLANDKPKLGNHRKYNIDTKKKDINPKNSIYLSKRNKIDFDNKNTLFKQNTPRESAHVISVKQDMSTMAKRKESIINSKDSVAKKIEKNDNDQVASVKVDDSIEEHEDLVRKLDPSKIFLEADANITGNNTSTTKLPPKHGHVKATPPKPNVVTSKHNHHGFDQTTFIAIIAGCCVAGVAGIILASFCWYKLRQESQNKNGQLSPSLKKNDSVNDKKVKSQDEKMVESAEVFHYLHAKKQMQQLSEAPMKADYSNGDTTEDDDEEDEDTVYECPGLAPPGDMKVVNPLFSDAESHHSDKHSDSSPQSGGGSPTPPPPPYTDLQLEETKSATP